ncbi:hypothetical protein [Streptomyces rochei]|uniref:hypothetical protein n=1 Tax=Streptomyces rochei TaxID=1928 RepID=UPI0040628A37
MPHTSPTESPIRPVAPQPLTQRQGHGRLEGDPCGIRTPTLKALAAKHVGYQGSASTLPTVNDPVTTPLAAN